MHRPIEASSPGLNPAHHEAGESSRRPVEAGLVSVVLPTFNGVDHILDAIESVRNQSYTHWGLQIVVDGSTDRTTEVVAGISDERCSVIVLDSNGGVAAARNVGIEASHGEFVAFLDDDDVWLPDKLRQQVELMNSRPGIALVHGGILDIMDDGRRLKRLPPADANDYSANLVRDCLALSTVLVRRTALDSAGGFDPDLRSSEEWDLWSRILKDGRAAHISDVMAQARQRPGSITHGSPFLLGQNRARVLRRLWPELRTRGLRRRSLAFHLHYTAGLYLKAGYHREARRRSLRSMRLRPGLRAWLTYALGLTNPRIVEIAWRPLQSLRRRWRA